MDMMLKKVKTNTITHAVKRDGKIWKCLLASTIIPIAIMAFAYYKVGIYPGGKNTVLTFDMYTQYMPFFASLRYIDKSDNSLFFNMSGTLGNNFMGFAYYIFSPFTWLTVLFTLNKLPEAIYFTALIRIGLCGLTFCIYLLYTYDHKRYFGAAIISCCYALMSYNVGYSINVMWLDAVLMLPVILIGIERVIRDEGGSVLIISIALSMIWNYYITCMSIIFVAFYTIIRLTELHRWSVKRMIKLVISGVLGLCISMPVVMPGVMALRYGKMDETVQPLTHLFRYNIINVLGQLVSGRYDTVFDDGLPLLYCGSATIVLVICFFISREYMIKVKFLYGGLIVFYLFSMCFIPLDRAMHGFRETVCFEGRYSFTFCCMLLIIAYRAIEVPIEIMKKYHIFNGVKRIAGIFVIIELVMNSSIIVSKIMIDLHYKTAEEYSMILRDKTALLGMIDDHDFYRISNDKAYTDNDGAWLGYNGFGYFSSCYNLKLMNYLGSLGECQSYHILEDHDRSPLLESLFGAKYKLSYAGWRRADEIIATRGLYTLSKNSDALSLGYMVDYDSGEKLMSVEKNAFENQNTLAKEISGINENVFVQLEPIDYDTVVADGKTKIVRFRVITKLDAPVWIYIGGKTEEDKEYIPNNLFENQEIERKLFINGGDYGTFRGNDTGAYYTLYIADFPANENINIELRDSDNYGKVYVSQFDKEAYKRITDKLGQNQLTITNHRSGRFDGIINAGDGGNMLLTLPAIDGWKIKVDGEKLEPDSYREVLLLVPLRPGIHEINIAFMPPGFIVGIIIGSISMMITFFITKCNT